MPKPVVRIRRDAARHNWFVGFLDRLFGGI